MKALYPFYLSLALFFFTIVHVSGQVIITTDNMPGQGDTIRVSQTTAIEIANPSETGFDYTWDYSTLEPETQTVIQYISPSQTPPLYQFTFNSSVTNLASPIQGLDFFQFPVTDTYEFYKNSSNEFVRAGYAASIMGFPLPMKYSQPERLYKFPLSVSSTPDSSISQITVQYPTIGYFNQSKKRVNYVDGSGTLITPYGTFNTLRVKSIIYERDSLYLDSLQSGVPIIRNIIEYKWLSTDHSIPVLTITEEGMIYTIQYIDTVRNLVPLTVNIGEDVSVCQGESVTLSAEVQGGEPPYNYLWSSMETTQTITVTPDETTVYSVLVTDSNQNFIYDEAEVNIVPFDPIILGNDTVVCADHNLTFNVSGSYDQVTWFINDVEKNSGTTFTVDSTGYGLTTLNIKVAYTLGSCLGQNEIEVTFQQCEAIAEISRLPLLIFPNPAGKLITIQTEQIFNNPVIRIKNVNGMSITDFKQIKNTGKILIDIEKLKAGIYFITLEDTEHLMVGKFIKL